MKIGRVLIRPIWIATVICGLVFFSLLSIRLDLFRASPPDIQPEITVTGEKETWMNIYQKKAKIGYTHRRMIPNNEGYSLFESTHMQINSMGMIQDIHLRTAGNLRPDFSVASFNFDMQSGLFYFRIYGRREGDILRVFSGEQEIRIPVTEDLFLTSGILDATLDSIAKPGQTKTLMVFDPSSMGRRPVHITMKGYEPITISGKRYIAKKVSIEFMGVSQTTWIDEDGETLQEEGLLGIRLQRTTRKEAEETTSISTDTDFTEMVSVLSNKTIEKPFEFKRMVFKLSGISDSLDLNGGRQRYENGILSLVKETISNPSTDASKVIESVSDDFLKSDPFIQSDHKDIQKLVADIISPDDSLLTRIKKMTDWIYTHIEKRPVLSVPNAIETLNNRMGDCNEHAVLLAAMARAANIPAQIETGLVYQNGRFYYHAWNTLYFWGEWITVDATMNQIPTDVTHIRMVRGNPAQQLDLVGIIGNIRLEIMELSK